MKRLLLATVATSLMAGFSFAQKIDVDLKMTYRVNAVLDGISTYQFRQHGNIELNPLAAPFVNQNKWVEAGLILIGEMALVDWLESVLPRKLKGLAYAIGSLAHGYCTWSNRQHGGTMYPLPIFKVRW